MNHIDNKKQAPLVSLQLQRIRGFEILHFFTEIGIQHLQSDIVILFPLALRVSSQNRE